MPDEFPPECCFTLVFCGRRGNLDLVASSPEEAQAWIQGMRMLIENLQNMDEGEKLDQYPFYAHAVLISFGVLSRGTVILNEQCSKIPRLICIWISSDRWNCFPWTIFLLRWISDLFMTADKNKDGRISFKEVQKLLKLMNIAMNELHANTLFTVRRCFLRWACLKLNAVFLNMRKNIILYNINSLLNAKTLI